MELNVDGLGVEKLVLLLVIAIEEDIVRRLAQIHKTKKQPKKSV